MATSRVTVIARVKSKVGVEEQVKTGASQTTIVSKMMKPNISSSEGRDAKSCVSLQAPYFVRLHLLDAIVLPITIIYRLDAVFEPTLF